MKPRLAGTEPGAGFVRDMFARVAPRYDFLNHLLSFHIDRLWRRAVPPRFRDILARPGARVLDLCCGTGDLALALERHGPAAVIGSDFCHSMLLLARQKRLARMVEADALRLPFADAAMDLVTVAFGFRNLADYDAGLREIKRVLRPDGWAAILEFSEPTGPLFGPLYRFYFERILPPVGGAVSGDRAAYAYLRSSVLKFPPPDELAAWMREVGFRNVSYQRLTFGAACLHCGQVGPA
jgi:demethylmenaquinone methyltransferase/2-methoxy-6-polyprenyl-1,4-benzoquinol methylase